MPTNSIASNMTLTLQATNSWCGIIALLIFIVAYIFVILEDVIHLKKSKPVILAAGLIWILVALLGVLHDKTIIVNQSLNSALLEYGELFLFLLVAMTYINAMEERQVFY